MRDAGIDFTVLSPPCPHIHNGDDHKSIQAIRENNENYKELLIQIYDDNAAKLID